MPVYFNSPERFFLNFRAEETRILYPDSIIHVQDFDIHGTYFDVHGTGFDIHGTEIIHQGSNFDNRGQEIILPHPDFDIHGAKRIIPHTKFAYHVTYSVIHGALPVSLGGEPIFNTGDFTFSLRIPKYPCRKSEYNVPVYKYYRK